MDLSFLEIKDVLGDIKNLDEGGIDSLNFKNISIDSRTCLKNDLFIAIKGKNFDGHSFLSEVLNKGVKSKKVCRNYFLIIFLVGLWMTL